MRRIVLAILIQLTPLAAIAQDFDKGFEAYSAGDFEVALKEFRPLAEQGDVDAQFNLAVMYRKGEGVPQDNAQALRWYRMAANQGDAQAQNNLGGMYKKGEGAPRDNVSAHMWYSIATKNGSERSRENRDALAREMSPEKILEAERRAELCLESNYTDCD